MAYADYIFYTEQFRGVKIPETDFERIAERAGEYIDEATFNKAEEYAEDNKVKKCCCAIAEIIYGDESGGIISSETVGSHTVNYVNGANTLRTPEEKIYSTISHYLRHTGLLYLGV